jgi:hypothetical protein
LSPKVLWTRKKKVCQNRNFRVFKCEELSLNPHLKNLQLRCVIWTHTHTHTHTHIYIWIYIYHSFSIEVGTRISIDILNQQFIVVTL